MATLDHLVERGSNETGEADEVTVLLDGDVEDPIRGHHHPEVDDLVAVATEDDTHDVLSDVVHVALHSCHHDPRCRRPLRLLGLHVRLEIRHRALHRSSALDDLRQEHLPGAEEVADDRHPVHERPFDHVEWPSGAATRLLRVLLYEVDDPVHERVSEPLADRGLAPGEIDHPLRRAAGDRARVLDEPLGGVGSAVEEDVLDPLQQLRLDFCIDGELAGVDDPHVESRADGVVEERRVHRLAHGVVATEREREVRDPARDERSRTPLLYARNRLDECLREPRVLLDPRSNGEDVRVEDHILGRERALTRRV